MRNDKTLNFLFWAAMVGQFFVAAFVVAFWIFVVYVGYHFIMKFW